jgi:Transposase DDE domain
VNAKLPDYLHHYGPKTYATWQHVLALLVRAEGQLGFRRVSRLLRSLGIVVPTYSALCKFISRLPSKIWDALFSVTVNLLVGPVAIDGTGLSRTNPSFHYLKRIDRDSPDGKPVKLSIAVDTKSKRIVAARFRALPAHDVRDVKYLVKRLPSTTKILLADKGYDSEKIHEYCKQKRLIAIIPVRKGCKHGRHRKQLRDQFPQKLYNQRSKVETTFSVLKRCYGGSVHCLRARTQRAEIFCRLIQYNLKRTLKRLFQRSHRQHKL